MIFKKCGFFYKRNGKAVFGSGTYATQKGMQCPQERKLIPKKSHRTLLKVQMLKGLLLIVAAKCGFILPQ